VQIETLCDRENILPRVPGTSQLPGRRRGGGCEFRSPRLGNDEYFRRIGTVVSTQWYSGFDVVVQWFRRSSFNSVVQRIKGYLRW